MKRKTIPALDESEEREPITEDEFAAVVKHLLDAGPPTVRSENREPTKEELERRWKLVRRPRP